MSFGELSMALAKDPSGAAANEMELTENGKLSQKGRGYQLGTDLIAAVDVALALGRPLLVAGEPGCGKTELGYAVARRLGIERLLLHTVKSSSDAGELFYTYDALQRFRDSQLGQAKTPDAPEPTQIDVGDYVEFQALGRAILDAHEYDEIAHMLRGKHRKNQPPRPPRRSVVVIDEIDKAPRDFPNDLLHEIEALRFRVREFPAESSSETPPGDAIPAHLRPVVIITSNEERQLPDAFLRRCVFHEIPFPDAQTLSAIIASGLGARLARMGWKGGEPPALDPDRTDGLVNLLTRFRERDPDKKPGIAEMLDAAALLFISGDAELSVVRPAVAKLKRDANLFNDSL